MAPLKQGDAFYNLKNGGKYYHIDHRQFLAHVRKWLHMKKSFDSSKHRRHPLKQLFGDDVLDQFYYLPLIIFEKKQNQRMCDKKFSIE